MSSTGLVLIQGLYTGAEVDKPARLRSSAQRREKMFRQYADALGVRDYEWVNGRTKALANRMLRRARGTAPLVDALEIIELDEAQARASLADQSARPLWQEVASCAPHGFDTARSFILMGAPRQLLDGPGGGQRLLWLGRGLRQLSEAEFIAHYTGQHGPLVAKYAQQSGLKRYRQVPNEQGVLCDELRQLGLGGAAAPAVFAELVMGAPPLNFKSLREMREGSAAIKADEQRHIDFSRSMLLLA